MVFQCKNYSEITVETRTQLKSVIFTTDIFAVHPWNDMTENFLRLSRMGDQKESWEWGSS